MNSLFLPLSCHMACASDFIIARNPVFPYPGADKGSAILCLDMS